MKLHGLGPNDALKMALRAIIEERSMVKGDFQLSSGNLSKLYFNMKPTMLSAEGSYCITQMMLRLLRESEAEITSIGGLELGAVPLVGSVVTQSYATIGKTFQGLIVRKSPKGHGTQSLIEGIPQGSNLAETRVAVVEDVTSTGGSAMKAVKAFRDAGAEVVLILSILDREMGAAELFAADGIPFKPIFLASEFTVSTSA